MLAWPTAAARTRLYGMRSAAFYVHNASARHHHLPRHVADTSAEGRLVGLQTRCVDRAICGNCNEFNVPVGTCFVPCNTDCAFCTACYPVLNHPESYTEGENAECELCAACLPCDLCKNCYRCNDCFDTC